MPRAPPLDRATNPQPGLNPAARAVVTEPRSSSFRPTRTFKQQSEKFAHRPLTLQPETSVLNTGARCFHVRLSFRDPSGSEKLILRWASVSIPLWGGQ